MGIFQHTPGLTIGYYIWKSMIPSLIGNILGGGIFVGVMYWYLVSGPKPQRRRHVLVFLILTSAPSLSKAIPSQLWLTEIF